MAFLGEGHTGSFIDFPFSYSHGPVLKTACPLIPLLWEEEGGQTALLHKGVCI